MASRRRIRAREAGDVRLRVALGVFDEDTSQVHISVRLAQLRLTARSRAGVTQLWVDARQVEDGLVSSRSHTVDDASSAASYRLGDPSCASAFRSWPELGALRP